MKRSEDQVAEGRESQLLNPGGVWRFRSGAMRVSFLGQHRADIQEATKGLAQRGKDPIEYDMGGLRRVARHLKTVPRAVSQSKVHRSWKHLFCLLIQAFTTKAWPWKQNQCRSVSQATFTTRIFRGVTNSNSAQIFEKHTQREAMYPTAALPLSAKPHDLQGSPDETNGTP